MLQVRRGEPRLDCTNITQIVRNACRLSRRKTGMADSSCLYICRRAVYPDGKTRTEWAGHERIERATGRLLWRNGVMPRADAPKRARAASRPPRRRRGANPSARRAGRLGMIAALVGRALKWGLLLGWRIGWRVALVVGLFIGGGVIYHASTMPPIEALVDGRTRGSVTLVDVNGQVFAWRGDQFGGMVTARTVSPASAQRGDPRSRTSGSTAISASARAAWPARSGSTCAEGRGPLEGMAAPPLPSRPRNCCVWAATTTRQDGRMKPPTRPIAAAPPCGARSRRRSMPWPWRRAIPRRRS